MSFLGELTPLVVVFVVFALYLVVPRWVRWEQMGARQSRDELEREARSHHPAGRNR